MPGDYEALGRWPWLLPLSHSGRFPCWPLSLDDEILEGKLQVEDSCASSYAAKQLAS
jgi:hypothetical protein